MAAGHAPTVFVGGRCSRCDGGGGWRLDGLGSIGGKLPTFERTYATERGQRLTASLPDAETQGRLAHRRQLQLATWRRFAEILRLVQGGEVMEVVAR